MIKGCEKCEGKTAQSWQMECYGKRPARRSGLKPTGWGSIFRAASIFATSLWQRLSAVGDSSHTRGQMSPERETTAGYLNTKWCLFTLLPQSHAPWSFTDVIGALITNAFRFPKLEAADRLKNQFWQLVASFLMLWEWAVLKLENTGAKMHFCYKISNVTFIIA